MKLRESGRQLILADRFIVALLFSIFCLAAFFLATIGYLVVKYNIDVDYLTEPIASGVQILAIAYGVVRAWVFHPAFDTSYRRWLATTPWTSKHPLPKGPLHLVWKDVVAICILSLIAYLLALTFSGPSWPYAAGPIAGFAGGLAFVWSMANWNVDQKLHVYALVAVPILFGLLNIPLAGFLLCPIALAGIAWHGVRQSLLRFPWDDFDAVASRTHSKRAALTLTGWPYDRLLGDPIEVRVVFRQALVEGILVAGWVWFAIQVGGKSDPHEDLSGSMALIAIGALIGAFVRLNGYGSVICSNLCFGLRIASKKWIIPEHDQVLVAPAMMVLLGCTTPWLLYNYFGASIAVACSLAVGLVVLIGRGAGPSLEKLYFTGVHSKFGSLTQSKEFISTQKSK